MHLVVKAATLRENRWLYSDGPDCDAQALPAELDFTSADSMIHTLLCAIVDAINWNSEHHTLLVFVLREMRLTVCRAST